jgi:N-methylhydantoinase B
MTNTKNTPIEVIESSYPLMCKEYTLRQGTGGDGLWTGGEGIIKHYSVLESCTFSIISDRRRLSPKGVKGGSNGSPGKNIVLHNVHRLQIRGKETILLEPGDEVTILTPGAGGYGQKNNKE